MARLPIRIVSTGTGEPLIDLAKVSPALNQASADADLVVLEGMGRGVESNLDAVFSCDALNLAMLKDAAVAKRVGGTVYDVVSRFRGRGGLGNDALDGTRAMPRWSGRRAAMSGAVSTGMSGWTGAGTSIRYSEMRGPMRSWRLMMRRTSEKISATRMACGSSCLSKRCDLGIRRDARR